MPRRNGAMRQSVAAMLDTAGRRQVGEPFHVRCRPDDLERLCSDCSEDGANHPKNRGHGFRTPAVDPPDSKTTHRDGANEYLEIVRLVDLSFLVSSHTARMIPRHLPIAPLPTLACSCWRTAAKDGVP